MGSKNISISESAYLRLRRARRHPQVTLEGCPEDVWIFQIAEDLTVGNGAIVHLSGGVKAANIFWQVVGQITLGATAHFEGVLLSQTAIHLNTGASINGRLLAQSAVTLNGSTVAPLGRPRSWKTVSSK